MKTITFVYDPREDRIVAGVNASGPDPWSCWITRRLALNLLGKSGEFLATTSSLTKRAAPEHRGDLASFERESAMAQTAGSMSPSPRDPNRLTAAGVELAHAVTLTQRGEFYQIELRGEAGGGSEGVVKRAELQRMIQMLHDEVVKAGWTPASAAPQVGAVTEPAPASPIRH